MAGFMAKSDNVYIGTLKLAGSQADIHNGMFVNATFSAGTAAVCTGNTGIVYFVENVIDSVDEQQINDINYVVSAGQYLRIKRLVAGDIFVTNKVVATVVVGDIVDVGTTGVITGTSGSPLQTFQVIEKPTMWGVTCYKCIVLN